MSSTLLVPVPEAEERLARWWPLWQPPRARGIAAHVSVCFPFLRRRELTEAVLAGVAETVRSVARFDARFEQVGHFPATVYLAPEPAGPFVALMRGIRERFPDCRLSRPHDGLVPHLTVLTCADERLLDEAAAAAGAAPPIVAAVDEVWLLAEPEHGPWVVEQRFPLGR